MQVGHRPCERRVKLDCDCEADRRGVELVCAGPRQCVVQGEREGWRVGGRGERGSGRREADENGLSGRRQGPRGATRVRRRARGARRSASTPGSTRWQPSPSNGPIDVSTSPSSVILQLRGRAASVRSSLSRHLPRPRSRRRPRRLGGGESARARGARIRTPEPRSAAATRRPAKQLIDTGGGVRRRHHEDGDPGRATLRRRRPD